MRQVKRKPKRAAKGAKAEKPAQNSEKKKRGPKGPIPTSFKLGNPWRFKKGQSGNPGGRPKLLSEAYREWLEARDGHGITNASKVAISVGSRAAVGDIQSAKEMRSATEGDTVHLATWQTEIVEALRAGTLTAEEVVKELGLEDAKPIIVAAGQVVPQGAPSAADAAAT